MATISATRRPIREGAERSNEVTCRIMPIPSAPGETIVREQALTENGLAEEASRGRGKNSNTASVRVPIHS
jgi:hypothetical protein